MPDLPLSDISLHYEVDGRGPPLLMLAGMLSDSASWGALAPLLSDHFTLIRPDNRSTGRTTPWDAETSVAQMARDALALMDHLGHETFHVVGHSMGGLMAMELFGLAPDHIRALSILASAPVRAPRTMAVFDALLAVRRAPEGEQLWLRALYPWIFATGFFTDPNNTNTALAAALAYPHAQSADAMAHQLEALRGFRPTVRPSDLTCPTKVLHGAEDLLIPRAAAEEAFAEIPSVTQTTLPDAGHSIHWDAAEAVAQHLRQFHDTAGDPR
ncbi:alpha/beta fold hydrolase [Sulfitobacter sp. 1A13191]|jgi:pimeloyl-ACP methyl ester carboxylesterase|uniref:alpha/beta fold hydrolase n=1 Tax=unclassified Sulfitobacter TaxID=196795 RepID=UPI00374509A5